MIGAKRLRMATFAITLAGTASLQSGCLQTAAVGVLRPAHSVASGRGRVVLVGVANDEAGLLATQLNEQLGDFAQWEIVDPGELAPIQLVSADSRQSLDTLVNNAAAAGVELLVSAEIEDSTIEVSPAWKVFSRSTKARLAVRLSAYCPRERETRATKLVVRTIDVSPGTESVPPEIARKLMASAIDEFLRDFQPTNEAIRVNLATRSLVQPGGRLIRLGNREAHLGRWSLASQYWQQALADDSTNDAALFNLAVAAMTDRRFEEAEDFALQAMRMRPDPIYIEGLDCIKQLAEEDRQVRYQTGESVE